MDEKIAIVKKEQKRVAKLVAKQFKNYYLTGGTALAFYFNHRFSEDLDFFTQQYVSKEPEEIMGFIKDKTRFSFQLDFEQDGPDVLPIKIYYLEIKKGIALKIDFVKDSIKNLHKVKNGLHSIEDIYCRKIFAAIGTRKAQSATGMVMATGRQAVKDLFDIYYLSTKYFPISKFFFKHFPMNEAARLDVWYRGFNRTEAKLELVDTIPQVDPGKVFAYLDREIFEKMPDKII